MTTGNTFYSWNANLPMNDDSTSLNSQKFILILVGKKLRLGIRRHDLKSVFSLLVD
jgi:hypothetical protein